jgi:hypothetical protein
MPSLPLRGRVRAGAIFKFKITLASIFCLDLSQNEHIFFK